MKKIEIMKKNRKDRGDNGGYLRMIRRCVFRSPHPLELVLVYGTHFLLSTLCYVLNLNLNLNLSSSSTTSGLDSVHSSSSSSSSFFANTSTSSSSFLEEGRGGDGLGLQQWLLFTSIGFSFYTLSEYWFHRLLLHHVAQKVHDNHHTKPKDIRFIATPIIPVIFYDLFLTTTLHILLSYSSSFSSLISFTFNSQPHHFLLAVNGGVSLGQFLMDFTHLLCHFGPLTTPFSPSSLYPCPLSTSDSKFLTPFSLISLPFHALAILFFSLCNQTIKYARSWHLHHHFTSEEACCFGLTTPFWDVIFGTLPQPLHHWLSLRILPPKSSYAPSSSFDKVVLFLATVFLCIPLPLVSFVLLSLLSTIVHSLKAIPLSLSSSKHLNSSQQCSLSSGLQNSYPFQPLAVIPPFIVGTIGTLLVALSVPSSFE